MSIERASVSSVGARKRGRPPGSRNKPKSLILSQMALHNLREKIGPYLPSDDMEYLEQVLEGQDAPKLNRDLDIFLALQLKALLPQLAEEIKSGSLTREATQRSSTVKELLALRFQMEKQKDGDAKPNQLTFIQNIFESRGIDPQRMAELVNVTPPDTDRYARPVGELPERVSGDDDRDEGPADEA